MSVGPVAVFGYFGSRRATAGRPEAGSAGYLVFQNLD